MKNVTYINAGAGSGKTYALNGILADVLREKKARPDQMILTTFTKMAANEFMEKSKARLFKEGLFDEANMIDGALIGTVHSVAYSVVARYWYFLGLPPEPVIMTDEDEDLYRSQSMGTLPTEAELRALHRFAENFNIKKDTRSGFVDYDFWRSDLADVIAFATNYEISDFTRSREESKAFYRSFVNPGAPPFPSLGEMQAAVAALREIFSAAKDGPTKTKRIRDLKDVERGLGRGSFHALKTLLGLCGVTNQTKRHPAVTPVIQGLALMWQSPKVYDEVAAYIDLIFNLAERWRKEYAEFKKRRNLLDFNDLEKFFLQLLRDPLASKEIGAQYRYVFVDEFQDCSPMQVKIFMALADVAEHSWWVGDMKQSVYAFRGSDTRLVDAVVKMVEDSVGSGCDTSTLPYSWRSVPGIVDFCNDVFVRAFSPGVPAEKVVLEAHGPEDPHIAPLKAWNVEGEGQLAAMVHQLIQQGARPCEIAVLNRFNAPLVGIGEALSELGIPVGLSSEPLMSSRAAVLAKAVLEAVDNEADTLAKAEVAFLLDPRYDTESLISETLAHVDPETGRPDHSFLDGIPLLRRLAACRDRFRRQSVAAMVESVVLELNLFEEAKKCAPADESRRVLAAVVEAAKAYEDSTLRLDMIPTVKGFVDYISDESVTLPGDPEGVALLSVHKSKGLEWKYVIVTSLAQNPDCQSKLMRREMFGVHFHRDEAPGCGGSLFPEVCISVHPFVYGQGNTNVPAPIDALVFNNPCFEAARRDRISEETRLLYVAFTRPSHQLILSLKGNQPLRWLQDVGLEDMTGMDVLVERYGFVGELPPETLDVDRKEPPDFTFAVPEGERRFGRRDIAPSMVEGVSEVAESHDFRRRIPLGRLPKDADMDTVGNCIHHIFRLCGDAGEDAPLLQTVKSLVADYGLETALPDREEILASWRRLIARLEERHGAVRDQDHERPFILHKDGRIFTGSIDLCLHTDEGMVLVDYKTCPRGNSAILDPKDPHYAGRYAGQLRCYRDALEASGGKVIATYLYYPVSGLLARLPCPPRVGASASKPPSGLRRADL